MSNASGDDTRVRDMAPHPLGAALGPAAIGPRRKEPLLVAEIIRLLERHGVPWNQAVREAAGLMAQTVEEAEGWWAFEMSHEDSPPEEEMIRLKRLERASGRKADEGLKEAIDKMLFAHEEVVADSKGCDTRPGSGKRFRAALTRVESLFGRIKNELTAERIKNQNRLEWIARNDELEAELGRIREELKEARTKHEAEVKAMSKMFGEVCEPLHECCQKYKLGLGGEHVQRLVVEEVDRLRSSSLTPEEAEMLLWELDRDAEHPYFTFSGYIAVTAKLRFISGGALKEGATQ